VARGFAGRIVAALCDMGVANKTRNGSCSVGRLRVHTGDNERVRIRS
jgi:hypothetical protein